jgi:alcohol dehydrogenase, propanol-preferring
VAELRPGVSLPLNPRYDSVMPMMRATVFDRPGTPLAMRERQIPDPAPGEILVEIAAYGICRTDLDVVDGELPQPKLPIVPRHEIVGRVAAIGVGVSGFALGGRVGVPWLGATCGVSLLPIRARKPLRSPAVHRLK